MYETDNTDTYVRDDIQSAGLMERVVPLAKIGFLVVTGYLAVQIFMKAIYFAYL